MAISTYTTVAQLVTERPARARIFERLGIDYCCKGDRSLAKACRENGLAPTTVAELLDAAVDATLPLKGGWYGSYSGPCRLPTHNRPITSSRDIEKARPVEESRRA